MRAATLEASPRVRGTYAIPPLMVTGERRFDQPTHGRIRREAKPPSIKKLRLLAARAKSDVLVVFDYGYRQRQVPNGWVATSVLLLPVLFVPMFAYGVYPAFRKITEVTPLRKIGAGFFLVAASFGVCAHVETLIQAGQTPTIWWQLLAYALITAGEILISVTSLEFFYTQAPRKMKSVIMSVKMFAVSLGNLVAAGVNFVILNPDKTSKLPGASYYLFFVGMMLVTGLIYIPVARAYKVKNYMQDDEEAGEAA